MKEIQEWLEHSAIFITTDIYSHLNYSSKLNVANTLTNVFNGETTNLGRQDDKEAKALITALFRGAEHEQAEEQEELDELQNGPLEAIEGVTDEMMDDSEEVRIACRNEFRRRFGRFGTIRKRIQKDESRDATTRLYRL